MTFNLKKMVQGQCTSFNHKNYLDREQVTLGHREEKVYSRHGFTEIHYGLDLWFLLKVTIHPLPTITCWVKYGPECADLGEKNVVWKTITLRMVRSINLTFFLEGWHYFIASRSAMTLTFDIGVWLWITIPRDMLLFNLWSRSLTLCHCSQRSAINFTFDLEAYSMPQHSLSSLILKGQHPKVWARGDQREMTYARDKDVLTIGSRLLHICYPQAPDLWSQVRPWSEKKSIYWEKICHELWY